ncbi:MAG: TraB/GumN family protein [Prevotellaceae bacterium]|nr:TraB/GumN family protein [Prevotellaceae bacterium]MDY6131724.1 TraB/GumN family protein [Prevotella sp.]
MARKSTLVAVGNWHLSGMQGLIALLREKGYEVTPIE